MTKTLRVLWRATALGLGTAVIYAVHLPTFLALTPLPRARRAWRDGAFSFWSRYVTALLGARLEVHGHPPSSPFLLVTNHLSYIDIPLLASQVGARFVARDDVRDWPFVGLLSRSVTTIFVDRSSRRDVLRVVRAIADGVASGDGVVLFPEGTSTPGERVAPFRSSLLEGAVAEGLPVHYATLTYRSSDPEAPAHLKVCWWGDMTFGKHLLELLALPHFDASLHFGDRPIADRCRKHLAVRLRAAVAEGFEPVVRDFGGGPEAAQGQDGS